MSWKLDSKQFTEITFKGYEPGSRTSKVSGLPILFYDHSKPFTKPIKFYDVYTGQNIVSKPKAYIIPKGWWKVIDILTLNGVKMERLEKDSIMEVNAFRIENLKAMPNAYEGHHKNTKVDGEWKKEKVPFLKGDYLIYLNQETNRYLVEMLEPMGDDSFLSWNFFDGVMQAKEYYSDYRWNPVAEKYLEKNPALREELEKKKKSDTTFANSTAAQLDFVFKNSTWYEPTHKRYPVFRVEE